MAEVFKPRANMIRRHETSPWLCRDDDGHLICDGGPSMITADGHKWTFFIFDIGYHRLDGPAISEGQWYINDRDVTDEIQSFAEENNIDLENLSDEDKVLIALTFG